jgi:hypothetical protein
MIQKLSQQREEELLNMTELGRAILADRRSQFTRVAPPTLHLSADAPELEADHVARILRVGRPVAHAVSRGKGFNKSVVYGLLIADDVKATPYAKNIANNLEAGIDGMSDEELAAKIRAFLSEDPAAPRRNGGRR